MYRKMFEEAFSDVAPRTNDNEFISNVTSRAEEKTTRRLPKRAVIIPIAAALCAVLTVTAGAAGISALAGRFFDANAAEELLTTDIFIDSDGNVSVNIDEFISDGMTSYAVVRYTALTDEGKDWLNSGDFTANYIFTGERRYDISWYEGILSLAPCCSYVDQNYDPLIDEEHYKKWLGSPYAGGISDSFSGLENGETEKTFMLILDLEKKDTNGEIVLYYQMPDGERASVFSTENRAKERIITLDAEPDDSKYYIPNGVRISQLGATVYGEYTREDLYKQYAGKQLNISSEERESFYMNTYLVMNDGTKLYLGGRTPFSIPRDPEMKAFPLLGSSFRPEPGENNIQYSDVITIDPDDVVGIQIEDKYYGFTE